MPNWRSASTIGGSFSPTDSRMNSRGSIVDIWKRFGEKEVSHSMAHYLQAVAALKAEKGHVRVGDIADRLAVSKSGVTSMLRSLQWRGLVDHERYGCVELTDPGLKLAERTESN